MQVFLGYDKGDRDFAKRLYNDLKKAGVSPWMDIEDILPGQIWKDSIRKAIRKSKYFTTNTKSKIA